MARDSAAWHSAAWCGTARHGTAQHGAAQCYMDWRENDSMALRTNKVIGFGEIPPVLFKSDIETGVLLYTNSSR